uniref:Protein NEDD1 n=1 Tax=Phallusia mammillata TaxID=59560 RepID=A0A6F9DM63_9ASCI|nr:protein NEDD1 [Phallusia mammillata]
MSSDSVTLFASCGDDIKLWDTKNFQIVKQYNYHKGNVKDISWTSDNSMLCSASASGDKILLCDWKKNEKPTIIGELADGEKQTCARVSYSGKKVYSGGVAGDVNVWDRESRKLKKTFQNTHTNPITCMTLNKSETFIATGSNKGSVVIRNLNSDVTMNPQLSCKGQAVRSMVFSPWKHSLLAMALDDGSINLWDSLQQSTYHNFTEVHKAPAMALAFSPFNDLISASVGLDKYLVVYDVTKHKVINKTLVDQPLTSVSFAHDGVSLFVGSSLGRIYQFDLRSFNQAVKDVVAHTTSVQCINVQNIRSRRSKSKMSEAQSDVSQREITSINTDKRHGRGDFDPKPQEKTNNQQNGGLSNGFHGNKPVGNAFVNSTPSVASRFQYNTVDDLGGIISPVRDEVFGNCSVASQDGNTTSLSNLTPGMSDTIGSYTDDILSPLGSNAKKANKQWTPHSGVQTNTRTSPHPLRESHTFKETPASKVDKKEAVPTIKSSLTPSLASRLYADKTATILKTPAPSSDGVNVSELAVTLPVPPSAQKTTSPSQDVSSVDAAPSTSSGITSALPNTNTGTEMTVFQYQAEYLRNTVKELVEEMGDEIRQQNNEVLTAVVKLFLQQEDMIRQILEQRRCNINEDLLMEVERLKEENERLRRKF